MSYLYFLKKLTEILIVILSVIFVRCIQKGKITDDELLRLKRLEKQKETEKREQQYRKIFFRKKDSYEDRMIELSKMGRTITPTEYLLLQLACAVVSGIAGYIFFGWIGLFTAIAGYMLPVGLFQYCNNRDNEKMMPDIKTIYDTLIVSLEAGVFLTEAIADCYGRVENHRLKKALLELNSELIAKNQIDIAIDKFEMKFSNEYISNLCVILRQASESGMSVNMLSDMSEHMTDVAKALNIKKQRKLDGEGVKVELLLYIGIIAICMYVTMTTFSSTLVDLF